MSERLSLRFQLEAMADYLNRGRTNYENLLGKRGSALVADVWKMREEDLRAIVLERVIVAQGVQTESDRQLLT